MEAQGCAYTSASSAVTAKPPNDVALRWFGDLFGVFAELGWGYALWEFDGPFGIVAHGRPGARYELIHGYQVDRELLDLMLAHRA